MEVTKKSMFDISWKVTESEYRADPAYSYSTISRFMREGFDRLPNLYDKIESPSLLFGSIVDSLITGGEDEFNERFEVAEMPKLSDSLEQVARLLFSRFGDVSLTLSEIPDEEISKAGEECNYYANPKYKIHRIKTIRENCQDYYNLLALSKDKTLINGDQYRDAVECVRALKTSPATSFYFAEDTKDIQRFYQLKFKAAFDGIDVRCMSDLLIVVPKDKIVIPCDLKTSYKSEINFYKSFIEWNYFVQAQLYWWIIRQNMDNDEYFKDFKLLDYRFIVVSNSTRKPLVWEYADTQRITDEIRYGRNGEIVCRNWRGVVKELDYYIRNNPRFPLNIYENTTNSIVGWLNR